MPVTETPLPWQQSVWSTLHSAIAHNRLGHALLLTGMAGVGKRHLLKVLLAALVCERPTAQGLACGQCHGCHYRQAGTHPDILNIVPETGHAHKVDDVRRISAFLQQTAARNGRRLVALWQADRMNLNAANALLKILEEPPAGGMLLLSSDHPDRLPATVRSRCQRLHLACPPAEAAQAWLATQPDVVDAALLLRLGRGAPLHALDWRTVLESRQHCFKGFMALTQGRLSPGQLTDQWQRESEQERLLQCLASWHRDLLALKMGAESAVLINLDLLDALQSLSTTRLQSMLLEDCCQCDHLLRAQRLSLRHDLLLEAFFSRWPRP